MKKLMFTLLTVCLLISAMPISRALAADETLEVQPSNGEPAPHGGNTDITVVPQDKLEKSEKAAANETAPYPADVTETRLNGGRQIVKTYELDAADDPAAIPRVSFERKIGASKWLFTLTDITKRETANAETKPHTETVTINTDTKELETILTLLTPTMEFKTNDEFAGILTLDIASIKVETAGIETSSYTMTESREYPHLSSADTSLVPKTVEDKGRTYTLAGVDWQAGNYETVDYEQVPEDYTAIATYTADGTSTQATGYITTAEYKGTLAGLSQGVTIYTAYFEGKEIQTQPVFTEPSPAGAETAETTVTPEPATTPAAESGGANTAPYVITALLAMVIIGAVYIITRRKTRHETTDNSASDADPDDGVDSGSGR